MVRVALAAGVEVSRQLDSAASVAVVVGGQVTITVGAFTSDDGAVQTGGPGTFNFSPSPTIQDAASNSAIAPSSGGVPGAGFRIF